MQQINSKIYSMVGFSLKSKSVVIGLDNVKTSRKTMHLVLACPTSTEKNIEKLKQLATEKDFALVKLKEVLLSELSLLKSTKIIGFTNFQLAKTIFSLAQEDNENFEIIKRGIF